ncbi:MAG: phosphatase PAP2 family protein [Candidatus Zixiibacteriota bacterium]
MLENLIGLDNTLFFFINSTLANPVTDFIMPIITNDMLLRVIYGVAMALILWKGNAKLRWLVLVSAATLLLTDQVSAGLLKPILARPRPCHEFYGVHLLVGCGGGYSMPSAHAANAFGQACLFTFFYRKYGWHLYGFAALIALSRVFVGVHYPGDIFVGAVIGRVAGVLTATIFNVITRLIRPWQSGD